MNRLISANLQALTPDRLPPAKRQGPARVLFLHTTALGFTTQSRNIRHFTGIRDDIDAVHIDLVRPTWVKALGKSVDFLHGWDFHNYRYLLMYRQIIGRWLRGPLNLEHFDVVHWMTQAIAPAILDQRKSGCPSVLHIDATGLLEVREFGESRAARAPFIAVERRMFAAADLVICMSKWASRSVINDYGVPESRVLVAPGSVPLSPVVAQTGSRNGQMPRIVFVGNDWERKGGPELLKLHQVHFAGRAELHVVSAKATPDRSARNVFWHGFVPRQQLLNELLPQMDLFVMPTWKDTLLWAGLEAAAAGLPVVSSRMAGIQEVVQDGVTGYLCPPTDLVAFAQAIERLIGDAAERERMGTAAREHIRKNFDPDVNYNIMIDRLVQLAQSARLGKR